jgi:hypothetical protein
MTPGMMQRKNEDIQSKIICPFLKRQELEMDQDGLESGGEGQQSR